MKTKKTLQLHNVEDLTQLGNYQIQEVLGVGGMGKVYKAYHPGLERSVAIKIILGDVSTREQKRFLNEAKMMAVLKHPNIIPVYDVASEEGMHYIVMEYIKGTPLNKIIRNKRLSARYSLQMIKEVALAVDYAHQNNIIHRDLKPGNLILDDNNHIWVMDFGLAKNIKGAENLTRSGEIMGTPRYMSPEQAQGKKIAAATDVYALGAILYEMLCGVPVAKGNNPSQILYNVIHKEAIPLRHYNDRIARELEAICFKALEKESRHRYKSAGAFAKDIEKFLQGEETTARPENISQKSVKSLKKNKYIFILFFLCALGVFSFWLYRNYQYQKQIDKHMAQSNKLLLAKKVHIEEYMNAIGFLEKALQLDPDSQKIKRKLYEVQKEMGLLALKNNHYLISQIAFKRCQKTKVEPQEVKELLKSVEQKRKKEANKQSQRLEKIMQKLAKQTQTLEEGLIDWYVTKISQMRSYSIMPQLVHYLNKGHLWQQRICTQVLGKLGDKTTKVAGKDPVEWLIHKLQKLNPKTQETEVIEVIWALGWLKDARANDVVFRARSYFGYDSLLWINTEVPFRWIPERKGKIVSADEWNVRGLMKRMKGDMPGAIKYLRKAIALRPNFAKAYVNLGHTFFALKQTKKAILYFGKAIEINPNVVEAYVNRGEVYRSTKEYSKALADFSEAIKRNAHNSGVYNNRGLVLTSIGKFKEALNDYNKAISMAPRNPTVYLNRGRNYEALDLHKNAIADYSKAIKLYPKNTDAYFNRGTVYYYLGQIKKALSDLSQAIRLNPRDPELYNNRAAILRDGKNLKEALADYKQALRLNPKNTITYKNIGQVYQYLEKPLMAAKYFKKYLALNPEDPQAPMFIMYINYAKTQAKKLKEKK